MKSFFLIKPNRWFDQQGFELKNFITADGKEVPYVKVYAADAISVNPVVDDVREIPVLNLGYHVQICEDEEQVKYLAQQQKDL